MESKLERQQIRYNGLNGKVHTTVNGVHGKFKVRKRPKPDNCELCDSTSKLQWHHWDDNDLSLGLWLCYRCHFFAEGIESGLSQIHMDKYFSLKQSTRPAPNPNNFPEIIHSKRPGGYYS